jgi:hypothetical protein
MVNSYRFLRDIEIAAAFPGQVFALTSALFIIGVATTVSYAQIGGEVSIARHLPDTSETRFSAGELFKFGQLIFTANWTDQDGVGRPMTKGTGRPLSDQTLPLTGARAFNRISAPDANSCAGCHNSPFGIPGGAGDIATNVFVLGQRFDFATFEPRRQAPHSRVGRRRGQPHRT